MYRLNLVTAFKAISKDVDLDPFTVNYCISRFRNEGIQFFTVTLPKLAKAVLFSIENGNFERPTNFAWQGALLKCFKGLLLRIFDRSGSLREDPCPYALRDIRQVCEYMYKLALPFSDEQLSKAQDQFVQIDNELSAPYDYEWVEQIRKDFETYYPHLANATINDVYSSNRPRAGSGTFSGKNLYEDSTRNPWYWRSQLDYSICDKFAGLGAVTRPIKSAPLQKDSYSDPDYSETLFVPKDSRGPRTIVREPFRVLSYQMGFHDWVKPLIERYTSNRVNFQDQQINRDLARQSSLDKKNATLDLSAASDRVDSRICQHIFRYSPAFRYIISRRTKRTKLPDGSFKKLNKLSGMGSGLTFPLMSLLIHLTITRAISNYSRRDYRWCKNQVYVYGDDIIVPTIYTDIAVDALKRVNLVVGIDKSYYKSFFRESCGGDYFMGIDVSPVRMKLASCKLEHSGKHLKIAGKLSTVCLDRHARELQKKNFIHAADHIWSLIESIHGNLPFVSGDSPVIGRWTTDTLDYPRDESGTYKNISCMYPIPDSRSGKRNEYIFLKQCLLRTKGSDFTNDNFVSFGSDINEVTVPRSIKIVRRKANALFLIGK